MTVTVVEVTPLGNRTELPKLTTAFGAKFVPVMVSVKDCDPCAIEPGDRAVICGGVEGTKLTTLKDNVPEVPPPGCGFFTSTEYVPAHLMVTTILASWEFTTVAETEPAPVTPPAVGGAAVTVTIAVANVAPEVLVAVIRTAG